MTDNQTRELYLEDVQPGMTFRSRDHVLDADQIVAFARQFDPQRFHLSEEGAQGSMFGTLAASGWHTAAITMSLLVDSIPIPTGVIGAGGEISWPKPTRPDDILHTESTFTDVKISRSKPHQGFITMETLTLNQHGEVRQKFVCTLVAFARNS